MDLAKDKKLKNRKVDKEERKQKQQRQTKP